MTLPSLADHLAKTCSPDLRRLIELLATSLMTIGAKLETAPLSTRQSQTGARNPTGDRVHRVDLEAHAILHDALATSPLVGCFASEEAADVVLTRATQSGPYAVVFDPLDGSNNLDSNGPTASIFGIYERKTPTGEPCSLPDLVRPGRELVAAGYALFGPSTQLVLSTGDGAHLFTLDDSETLRRANNALSVPDPGRKIFSVNDGHTHCWRPEVRRYVEDLRRGGYTSRYVGTMAADVHRVMRHGGIYLHPADVSGPTEQAKLRLLFEAAPLGFLFEQAGGTATNGASAILDVRPTELHQQVPVVFGSTFEVERFLAFQAADR
jgi:fructose-1,6-bisphosphatase